MMFPAVPNDSPCAGSHQDFRTMARSNLLQIHPRGCFHPSWNTLFSLTSSDGNQGVGIIMHINMLFICAPPHTSHWFRNWEHTHTRTILMSFPPQPVSESYMCVSGSWEWRGVAGQLERSLVKKSIKEKQRRNGRRGVLFLLAAVFTCKAVSSLSEWVQGLFIGEARFSEGKEVWVQDYDCFLWNFTSNPVIAIYNFTLLLCSLLQSSKERVSKCLKIAKGATF